LFVFLRWDGMGWDGQWDGQWAMGWAMGWPMGNGQMKYLCLPLPAPCSLLSAPCSLLPAPCSLLPASPAVDVRACCVLCAVCFVCCVLCAVCCVLCLAGTWEGVCSVCCARPGRRQQRRGARIRDSRRRLFSSSAGAGDSDVRDPATEPPSLQCGRRRLASLA